MKRAVLPKKKEILDIFQFSSIAHLYKTNPPGVALKVLQSVCYFMTKSADFKTLDYIILIIIIVAMENITENKTTTS